MTFNRNNHAEFCAARHDGKCDCPASIRSKGKSALAPCGHLAIQEGETLCIDGTCPASVYFAPGPSSRGPSP